MLQSRHPKHRRWYFFGPYLESLGNRCHLFLHPSAKIPPPPLVGIVMGFSAGSGDGSCVEKNTLGIHKSVRRVFVVMSWGSHFWSMCFFEADQFWFPSANLNEQFLFNDIVEEDLSTPLWTSWTWRLGGLVLWVANKDKLNMNLGTPKNFTKQNNHHPSSTIFGVVNQSPFCVTSWFDQTSHHACLDFRFHWHCP